MGGRILWGADEDETMVTKGTLYSTVSSMFQASTILASEHTNNINIT